MYDELVRRLINCATQAAPCKTCDMAEDGSCSDTLMKQAADAIEEMSSYVRQIEELRKDGYYLQKSKMMTYGQATMTMPLPTPPKEGAT